MGLMGIKVEVVCVRQLNLGDRESAPLALRRLVGVVVAVLLSLGLAACGSSSVLQIGQSKPQDPHYRVALQEARRLLSSAVLPSGARAIVGATPQGLSAPLMGSPGATNQVDLARVWRINEAMLPLMTWIRDHAPVGLAPQSQGGQSNAWVGVSWSAPPTDQVPVGWLEVVVEGDGAGRSLLRADAITVWNSTKPSSDTTSGPRVRVTIRGGCPRSNDEDVVNHDSSLRSAMIPGASPLRALVCIYTGSRPPASKLLNSVQAARLGRAIRTIPLGSTGGTSACDPLAERGAIIVFQYATHGEVDVWYSASACPPGLANGYVKALQTGNGPFFKGFLSALAAVE